ncbi:hypothetical protein CRUP_032686 [Coryphaenoides rupestris]|nr:hypothetical protein CRUP_032686 [Coryphaenoides rupestris]
MDSLYPFWMGALFIFFGILCILSERFPSPCLVVSSVCAHLAGVAFAIAAVVLYSINLAVMSFWWLCRDDNYYYSSWAPTNTPRSPEDMERCLEGKRIIQMVLGGVNVLLIILSVLQLCVSISCVVLGIKAVKKSFKKTDQVWLGGGGGEPVQDLVAPEQRVWVSSGMPTMREVRGKVVVVQKNSFTLGVPLQVEGGGGDGHVSDIQEKDKSLAKILEKAVVLCGGDNIILSHSSGSGIGTFWGMFLTPKRVAERVNPWLNHFLGQYIPDNPRPCFVVIAMDFPGFNLIQTIINLNWGDIMSVAMTKSDGVTVLTLKSDPGSACPPLCQILQTLCYSPVCCSVSQKLRSVLGTSHSTLGTVQINVGLLNMVLENALPCISRYGGAQCVCSPGLACVRHRSVVLYSINLAVLSLLVPVCQR